MAKKNSFILPGGTGPIYEDRLRIVVGTPGNFTSSIWTIWYKNHVYIGVRTIDDVTKVSLHSSGNCHFTTTREHRQKMEEEGVSLPPYNERLQWERKPTPPSGVVVAACITIPYKTTLASQSICNKKVVLIPPAPEHQARKIIIFYTYDELSKWRLATNQQLIAYAKIQGTNEYVVVICETVDFNVDSFIDYFGTAQFPMPSFLTKDHDLGEQPNLILWNDPEKDGYINFIDIGTIKILKD
jgi:hypothetical protein